MFAPEQWTPVTLFRHFMGPPFEISRELTRGVNAAENHLRKYSTLAGLANRLRSCLLEDEAELEAKGYSSAIRSREYAALIETLFCELYASLDGVRQTLFSAYRKVRGVQNSSTERLFTRAKSRGYGSDFPVDICDLLTAAYDSWFPRLRSIRTEVTHGDIGMCHLNEDSGRIRYIHNGLEPKAGGFAIDDLDAELNSQAQSVAILIDKIFASLCSKLIPVERQTVCGFYKGRCYERFVAFNPSVSFNDGRCISLKWFQAEPGYECPMQSNCGAFRNALEKERFPHNTAAPADQKAPLPGR
jgi:hypothetical protein